MEYLLNTAIVTLCISGIVYFLFIRPQKRVNKERASQKQRTAHLNMLAEGIEKLTQQDLKTVEPEMFPVSRMVRETWGYPPKRDQWFEEILSGDETGNDWDYAIHIHEGAEQYLGSEKFFDLERKFSCAPGVQDCKQEDREVFLIKTSIPDQKGVIDALWEVFLEAAAEGTINEKES